MSESQNQDRPFDQIEKRFALLEEKRQHQNEQIHKNLYLSLIITAGILGIFGQGQNQIVLLFAGIIAASTFSGLGVWTYLYARGRNQVKNEKRDIYLQYNDREYFEYVDGMPERDEFYSHWKIKVLFSYYILMTVGSISVSIWLLLSIY